MRHLRLGLLPSPGGGLVSLAATGQVERLTEYYFPAYLEAFEHLFYFSYQREVLSDYAVNPDLARRLTLLPRRGRLPYRAYAFLLPLLASAQFRACGALRAFQAPGAIPAMIARLLYGIPYVTTYGYRYHAFASVEGRRLASTYLRLLEPLVIRLAAGVIVTTQELASYVHGLVPSAKTHLIPNGVDTALFSPSEQPPSSTEGPRVILFVGRLTRQKNLARLLEALGVLAKRHSIHLRIIGEGPVHNELDAMASKLQVRCTFVGIVPHQTLPRHMTHADVFVLPSLVEGHPKSLIEAMSCGLPCVVSDCDGNRTLVQNEVTGLVFDPTNVRQMIAQLDRALSDGELAQALGQAARRHVCHRYDLHQLLGRETSLLQAVAERRPT